MCKIIFTFWLKGLKGIALPATRLLRFLEFSKYLHFHQLRIRRVYLVGLPCPGPGWLTWGPRAGERTGPTPAGPGVTRPGTPQAWAPRPWRRPSRRRSEIRFVQLFKLLWIKRVFYAGFIVYFVMKTAEAGWLHKVFHNEFPNLIYWRMPAWMPCTVSSCARKAWRRRLEQRLFNRMRSLMI